MSERIGKIGLNAGTPWSLFAENTAFEDCDGMEESKTQSTETTRLHREDMKIFGFCPARDNQLLVICKECQKIVQASASLSHYERKHPKMLSSLKCSPTRRCSVSRDLRSPTRTFGKSKLLKSPSDNAFIRIEEVDPTDMNVKIEEVPLTIPRFNHAAKGKLPKINLKGIIGSNKGKLNVESSPTASKAPQKKQSNNKDKEYDPERHCGVWIEDQTRNCTRSLTCKTHSLSSRRDVSGRSKSFDALLSDHKARMQNMKESGSTSGTNTPASSPTRNGAPQFPTKYERSVSHGPRSPMSKENSRPEGKRFCASDDHSSAFSSPQPCYIDYIPEDSLKLSAIPMMPHHPKPMLVNTFSGRKTHLGCSFFTRKFERLRWAASNMMEKCLKSNPQPSTKSNAPYKVISGVDDPSSAQSGGKATSNLQNVSTWSKREPSAMNYLNSSLRDNSSNLGPVPRVKTKLVKSNGTRVKRQFSMSNDASRSHSATRKRRHSADPSKVDNVNKEVNVSEVNSGDNNNIVSEMVNSDVALTMNEIGQVLNSLDTNSLDASLISSSILCSDANQTGTSTLTITGGNITGNLNNSMNLNSSLTLCHTMGINPQMQQSGSLSTTQLVVDQGQVLNQVVAPNVAVTQGMMVSLPNVTQVQNLTAYQGNLKEILPAPCPGKQLNSSVGVYIAAQGQNTLSQISNGSLPSQENLALTYSVGQNSSTMVMNIGNKYANTTTAAGTKRYIAPSSARLSQLVVRQPPQPSQRDITTQKANPFQKPTSYDQRQTPSPSARPPTPTKSPLQQQATLLGQSMFNNPQSNSTPQPITQLKHLQQQQQQQQLQQQQLISPLNSVVHADSLIYQQQILPKLTVAPGRSLQNSVATAQTLQMIDSSAPQGTSAL
eukprot:gene5848-6547_t